MDTIVRPIITEKSLREASRGWYTFEVDAVADKARIARDLEELYNVKVVSVRTSIVAGKAHRVGRRGKTALRPDWKKAVVRLAAGQKLDVFEIGGTTGESAK